MISRTSRRIVVSKWKDKRDVMFLSTKHRPNFCFVKSKRYKDSTPVLKPTAIAEYNDAKTYIDVSDQIKAYGSATRRGVKWFRKIFVELLCNTAVVNAYVLYIAKMKPKRFTITMFREQLVRALLQPKPAQNTTTPETSPCRHKILKREAKGRCVVCYAKLVASKGRKEAMKLTSIYTYCSGCPEKYLCISCFSRLHYSKRYV